MSRPIGALFHIAHGMSNAILMNVCLRWAVSGAYDRFGQLGREIESPPLRMMIKLRLRSS